MKSQQAALLALPELEPELSPEASAAPPWEPVTQRPLPHQLRGYGSVPASSGLRSLLPCRLQHAGAVRYGQPAQPHWQHWQFKGA